MNSEALWNWTFKGFVSHRGNVVQIWHDTQEANVQTDFGYLLKTLRTRSPEEWHNMKMARTLHGNFRPLTELKFKTNLIPYRPIGFFGVGRQTFTILAVATKHDFDNECVKALKLKSYVLNNPGACSNESDCLSDITGKA